MASKRNDDSMPPQSPVDKASSPEKSPNIPPSTPIRLRERRNATTQSEISLERDSDVFAFNDSIDDYSTDKPVDASPLTHRLSQARIPVIPITVLKTPTKKSMKRFNGVTPKQPLSLMNKHHASPTQDKNDSGASGSVLAQFNQHPACDSDAKEEAKEKEKYRVPSDTFSDCAAPDSDIGNSRHTSSEYNVSHQAVNLKNKNSPVRKFASELIHPDSEKILGGIDVIARGSRKGKDD